MPHLTRSAVGSVAAALVGFACIGCGSGNGSPARAPVGTTPEAAVTSGVVRVTRQDVTSVVVQAGNVASFPTFVVAVPAPGGQVSVSVKPGQHVAAGQQVGSLNGRKIQAVAAGTVTEVGVRGEGPARLPSNMPMVTLRYDGFGVPVTVSAENMYRVYDSPVGGLATLASGASGVDCQVVPAAASAGSGGEVPAEGGPPAGAPAGDGAATMAIVCLLPASVDAYQGQPAKVGIRFATVKGAVVLPVTAVAGGAQTGTVWRIDAGGRRTSVTVRLGVTDGVVVQVLDGLSVGDTVAAQAPDFVGP